MKKLTALFLALALILSLTACGGKTENTPATETASEGSGETTDGKTIKMAAIYGFTGSGAQLATTTKRAIELMVQNLNESGGSKRSFTQTISPAKTFLKRLPNVYWKMKTSYLC